MVNKENKTVVSYREDGTVLLIPFRQTAGVATVADSIRELTRIKFPTANTLRELEEDLALEPKNRNPRTTLSWSRGMIQPHRHKLQLQQTSSAEIDIGKHQELDQLE